MNRECIEKSLYFSQKPDFDPENERFVAIMAKRFERAMWAAWIPGALKRNKSIQVRGALFTGGTVWTSDMASQAVLQTLKPGYYPLLDKTGYFMRVYEDYEKPGNTLEDRLEFLEVIKSTKYNLPGDRKKSQKKEGLKPLENFGCVTSDTEIKKLIQWAVNEPKSKYGLAGFPYKEREDSELYIKFEHPLL